MNYQDILEKIYAVVQAEEDTGIVASYIPLLAEVNPVKFGVHLATIGQQEFGVGDFAEKFSIQSISKVLALSMAYQALGETIWERVGVEPSGTPFNSLIQLEADKGIPRNPFINAGALVICDILYSLLQHPKQDLLDFCRDLSDNPQLNYSQRIIDSEKSVGYRNIALCYFIKSFGNIHNEPMDVLDLYFSLCSIEMDCRELTKTFLFLANGGCKVSDGREILNKSQTKRINALLQTCGFYDESGEFTFKVGLPGKSGVGGGIIAIHPDQYCIGVWSPRLNQKGNSNKGMRFLERFTTDTKLSIF